MIEKDQLKQLGFSQELIDEVTRIADYVRKSEVPGPHLGEISTSVFFDRMEISTNDRIFYE